MIAFLLALLAVTVPPKPAAYVTDNAGVLDPARAHALNEKLAQFERDTSNQILVYVDRSLPTDTTIEQFANDAMHQWGVGQKGKDNGAVLFLFTADRKMRIEVGYGLESVLTDAKARDITSTIIKPRLKAADYDGAVGQGADAILAVVRGEGLKGTGRTVHEQKGAWRGNGFIFIPLAIGLLIGLVVLIVRAIRKGGVPRSGVVTPTADRNSSSWGFYSSAGSSDSSFSSSDSSSSSSDSGFDGGGGDSGGGGASDSW